MGLFVSLQRSFANALFPSQFVAWIDAVSDFLDNFISTGEVLNLPTVIGVAPSLLTTVPVVRQGAIVNGYASEGDGGGGEFYWDPLSSATANGGTVVLPTGHVGPGRWIRIFSGALNVLWFGATGDFASDDTAAINAAILEAENGSPRSGEVFFPYPNAGGGYRVLGSIVVPPSSTHTVWLTGEVSGTADGNGTRIEFGTPGSNLPVIDVHGATGVKISNFDLFCSGNAKYGILLRPSGGAGTSNIELENVNIFDPRDVAGAAAVCQGDVSGVQVSELYAHNCIWKGDTANLAYQAVGYLNAAGGNVKNAWLDNVSLIGFAHPIDGNISGPLVWKGGGASNNHLSILNVSSADVTVIGVNVETNSVGCQLLTGGQGSADGCVKFEGCNLFLDAPTANEVVHWLGGDLQIEGGRIQNQRKITISNVTNTTPAVVTVAAGHQLITGDRVQIDGVLGATGVNTPDGTDWQITVVGNAITLVGSTAPGVYTGGGIMTTEPKIVLGDAGVPKRGLTSEGVTWYGVVGTLPVYDPAGVRLTIPANAQATPVAIFSRGDVGFRPFGLAPTKLPWVGCDAMAVSHYAAGVLTTDASGNVSASTAVPVADLAPGVSPQVLVTSVGPATTWATAGGDWNGAVAANKVIGLSGTANVVAMHGTSIVVDSGNALLVKGADVATVAGTAPNLEIRAANETGGGASTGGDFITRSGTGTTPGSWLGYVGNTLVFEGSAGGYTQLYGGSASTIYINVDLLHFRSSIFADLGLWNVNGLRIGDGNGASELLHVLGRVTMQNTAPPAGTPVGRGTLFVGDGTGGTTAGGLYYKGTSGTVTPVAPP